MKNLKLIFIVLLFFIAGIICGFWMGDKLKVNEVIIDDSEDVFLNESTTAPFVSSYKQKPGESDYFSQEKDPKKGLEIYAPKSNKISDLLFSVNKDGNLSFYGKDNEGEVLLLDKYRLYLFTEQFNDINDFEINKRYRVFEPAYQDLFNAKYIYQGFTTPIGASIALGSGDAGVEILNGLFFNFLQPDQTIFVSSLKEGGVPNSKLYIETALGNWTISTNPSNPPSCNAVGDYEQEQYDYFGIKVDGQIVWENDRPVTLGCTNLGNGYAFTDGFTFIDTYISHFDNSDTLRFQFGSRSFNLNPADPVGTLSLSGKG